MKNIVLDKIKYEDKKICFFLDFDGTILDGDLFSGFSNNSVLGRFFSYFKMDCDLDKFSKDYSRLEKNNAIDAYLYLANKLSEKNLKNVRNFKVDYGKFFEEVKKYFFEDVIDILKYAQKNDSKIYIISNSPFLFLWPLDNYLGIKSEHIFGIDSHNGDKKNIVEKIIERNLDCQYIGLGDSKVFDTDFLKYIISKNGYAYLINCKSDILPTVNFRRGRHG